MFLKVEDGSPINIGDWDGSGDPVMLDAGGLYMLVTDPRDPAWVALYSFEDECYIGLIPHVVACGLISREDISCADFNDVQAMAQSFFEELQKDAA